ncbi:cobalamin-binding protein [Paraglaciecola sp.]|uniref:cobalamin-binding protein n=1 Tax=Paraglaciecola sp. TaxID=1920173 RepID=UPI0030F43BF5
MALRLTKKLTIKLMLNLVALCCSPVVLSFERIVSLAPHTTELIYALGAENKLVAVSDYSNYPSQASQLPSVANHNGVDFEAIVRLQPDLIVAWQGGNKPQDLARLASLGFTLYYSAPQSPADISQDIRELGKLLEHDQRATKLADDFAYDLTKIIQRYAQVPHQKVFYYMWTAPLMTIGQQAWANKLLDICGVNNIFADSPTPYPEVSKEQVISQQPILLIAAMKTSQQDATQYWQSMQGLLDARVIVADPDELHRFTPRLIAGLDSLCKKINGY